MTVTVNQPSPINATTWRITWSSDLTDPEYRIYQDGLLAATTGAEEWIATVPAGEALLLEILDDPDETPTTAYPGKITIGWWAVSGAASYRVDEYIEGAWTARATLLETGLGYYRWDSRYLEDVTTHQFRVVPITAFGNDGAAAVFSVLMVRHPDVPSVAYTYDEDTAIITISET